VSGDRPSTQVAGAVQGPAPERRHAGRRGLRAPRKTRARAARGTRRGPCGRSPRAGACPRASLGRGFSPPN